jgi:hypothetical protein
MRDSDRIAPEGGLTLQIVAAGNGWWVSSGPDASDISTYVFLDCEAHPELLALPEQARAPGWCATAAWNEAGDAIRVTISGPSELRFAMPVDRPELEAVRRARRIYICPTTPMLGLSPFLARDRSFLVELPRRSDD